MRADVASGGPADVAMVIDTVTRGGAERVLVTIANKLDRRRFRVHVITTREPGDFASELSPDVAVHSLNRTTRWDVASLRRFAALANRLDIRIVHTHSHSAAYFTRAAALLGGRWRHVMHDHHGPIDRAPALRLADRLLLHDVDHYFAVSDRLLRYGVESVRIPPGRCERLPNGVDIPAVPGQPADGPFSIVHLAHVVPDKGHALGVRVADLLRTRLAEFRWQCIGNANSAHADQIRAAVEDRGLSRYVVLLGERSDVAGLIGASRVGVLTSQWEGLPMALLEYMAAGRPVVVTDVGDCGRVVREAGGGVVVAPGDAEAFADALVKFAHDPEAAARAGALNRQHVVATYSSDAMVRRISAVYDQLLGKAPDEALSA